MYLIQELADTKLNLLLYNSGKVYECITNIQEVKLSLFVFV